MARIPSSTPGDMGWWWDDTNTGSALKWIINAFPDFMAKQGVPPPPTPGTPGMATPPGPAGGVPQRNVPPPINPNERLGALAQPTPQVPVPRMKPAMGIAAPAAPATPAPAGTPAASPMSSIGEALSGIQAPPAPEGQRVSSPSAPSVAAAPDISAILESVFKMQQAGQPSQLPLLADLLYRRM